MKLAHQFASINSCSGIFDFRRRLFHPSTTSGPPACAMPWLPQQCAFYPTHARSRAPAI
ncbi:hypothetical protein FA95DRAFT_1565899 [Auriscalpium vulgare]|uniref:Uncharacterized protein n=1 Tax=Auriscalpium vulgare TaxID=40419 RepID=A0ACB8RAE6_9AGAM|nr:hypothetical protein FA95DRAFT_1565899 [Auriscalpium vulgare]